MPDDLQHKAAKQNDQAEQRPKDNADNARGPEAPVDNDSARPATESTNAGGRTIDHPAIAPLKRQFPEFKWLAREFRDMVSLVVPREKIVEVCAFLRDDPNLRYDQLFELNAVDYLNYPRKMPGRFCVNYGLLSIPHNSRVWLKVFLNPEHPTEPGSKWNEFRDEEAQEKGDPGLKLPTVTRVWPSASWMEREAYDMMGLIFEGHPDLRRILTWNGFGNYPLRKDYPLRGVGEREGYKVVTRETA